MNKNIVIGVLVATTLLFAGLYFSHSAVSFGAANPTGQVHFQQEAFLQGAAFGSRNQSYFDSTGKLQVGASGTQVANFLFGTCNLSQNVSGSFVASSSATFLCSVTGVNAGDKIAVDMPQNAGIIGQGFVAINAYSTTTGVIAVTLENFSGAATSSFVQATSGVEYFDWR